MPECPQPPPGPAWVCQDGGWLPPGHPGIRPAPDDVELFKDAQGPPTGASVPVWPPEPTPPGPNHHLIECAKRGMPLVPGEVFFTPPLLLRDVALLKGTMGRTVLRPIVTTPGPLIIVEKTAGGDYAIQYPLTTQFEDFRLVGFPGQTGFLLRGGVLDFTRVVVANCGIGVRFDWAVNVLFDGCLFAGNRTGLVMHGTPGTNSITTIEFSRCRIAGSTRHGCRIGHGMDVLFHRNTSFESNPGVALHVEPSWPQAPISVVLRDVWCEANGQHVHDPLGLVTVEGLRTRY